MSGKRESGRSHPAIREFHSPSHGIFFEVKKRLYSGKSRFQKIEVIENDFFGKVLFLDGLVQTTERDEFFYHEMLVHPAFACHPSPRDVLIIGGGDGGALREVLRHSVKSARMVEIDAKVVEVCRKYFGWPAPDFRDPRARLVIGDGNEFIREAGKKFDVILVDSSDPVGPSTRLHERDFYTNLKARLRPGGVVIAQAGSLLHHLEQHRKKALFLKDIFKVALFYTGPVPTYPGGIWCYVFLSDRVNPLKKALKEPPPGLKYYNLDIHRSAFALPEFFKKSVGR